MFDKVNDLLINKDFVVPKLLICNFKKLNILADELPLLIYLINNSDIYDPVKTAQSLNLEVEKVVDMINILCDKDIIKIEVIKQGKLMLEKVNIEPLYKKLTFLIIEPNNVNNDDIYTIFETEFGRTLSPLEYEIIGNFIETKDKDFIILALKETVKRGITNIKYVDKVLVEWEKKGFKTCKDVEKDKIVREESINVEGLDYNWLDEGN